MKNFLLQVTFLLSSGFVSGQAVGDTTYLNAELVTTSKPECVYYRTMVRNAQMFYEVKNFWKTGEIQMSGKFSSLNPSVMQGPFIYYNKSGALSRIENYKNNQIDGKVKSFDVNGKFEMEYVKNVEALDNAYEFKKVIKSFIRFALTTISYPEQEINREADGKVVVKFYVGDNGKVFRPSVVESASKAFDEEVKYAVSSYNKWPTPMYQNQKTLVEIIITMNFELR